MTQLAHLMTSRPAGLRCVQPLLFREDETCLGVRRRALRVRQPVTLLFSAVACYVDHRFWQMVGDLGVLAEIEAGFLSPGPTRSPTVWSVTHRMIQVMTNG